jgi:hypothetical protein
LCTQRFLREASKTNEISKLKYQLRSISKEKDEANHKLYIALLEDKSPLAFRHAVSVGIVLINA